MSKQRLQVSVQTPPQLALLHREGAQVIAPSPIGSHFTKKQKQMIYHGISRVHKRLSKS